MIVEKQGFGTTLAFVVTRADADGIYIPPVGFGLGVDVRIPVNFGCGGLHDLGAQNSGEPQDY